jgi:hypothetical protein
VCAGKTLRSQQKRRRRVSYIGNYLKHQPDGTTLFGPHDKSAYLAGLCDEKPDELPEFSLIPEGLVLVCVVDNGPFEAALVCDNEHDYGRVQRGLRAEDPRPVQFFLIKREWVRQMAENELESDGAPRGRRKKKEES